jgi:hypothetical protein
MLRTAGCGRQAPQYGEALLAPILGLDITQMLSQASLQLARLRLRIAETMGEVAAD